MNNIYTDLAVECREIYNEDNDIEVEGVSVDVEEKDSYSITRIGVLNKKGMERIKKPIGRYITIDVPNLNKTDEDLKDEISKALAKETGL